MRKPMDEGRRRALALANRDYPEGDFGAEIRRAVKAHGVSIPIEEYLETLARRHELFARALRSAASAAKGGAS